MLGQPASLLAATYTSRAVLATVLTRPHSQLPLPHPRTPPKRKKKDTINPSNLLAAFPRLQSPPSPHHITSIALCFALLSYCLTLHLHLLPHLGLVSHKKHTFLVPHLISLLFLVLVLVFLFFSFFLFFQSVSISLFLSLHVTVFSPLSCLFSYSCRMLCYYSIHILHPPSPYTPRIFLRLRSCLRSALPAATSSLPLSTSSLHLHPAAQTQSNVQ